MRLRGEYGVEEELLFVAWRWWRLIPFSRVVSQALPRCCSANSCALRTRCEVTAVMVTEEVELLFAECASLATLMNLFMLGNLGSALRTCMAVKTSISPGGSQCSLRRHA